MTNRKCKIGKKAYAARRIAAVLMSATLAGTIAAGSPGIVQVSAASYSENADYIFEVLTRKLGYSEAAACGIMANIRCESTFNPHAWNAGGGSYGLCQWTGGRYGRLQSWCRSNGYDYTTIDGQLAYLEYELQNHYRGVEEYLRSVDNTSDGAYDAGQYYCYHFEAPASRGSVSVYRGGLASSTFWEAYRPAEWYFEDGVWRYIKRDGTYHTSWLTIDNKTYYLDENGNRISGWRTIDGNRYYFDKDGVMASGWVKIDGKDYYFGEDGPLITGLVMNSNSWYMLDEAGNIQASEELERYASSWNEKVQGEALASADGQSADKEASEASESSETADSVEFTASAETEETAAGTDTGEQPSLVASGLTSPADKKEPSLNLAGMGIAKAQEKETAVLPSISSSDTAAVDKDTDTEESAAEETDSAGITAEEAAAESTVEETASVESTVEETALAAETSAPAEEEIPDAEIADTAETTAEAADVSKSAEAETAETAAAAATTAQEAKDSKDAKEEADKSDKDDDRTDDAAQGAGTAPSETNEKASDEFAAADAMRAAAEATNEEAEEETPDGFFMIYDPASAEDQSDDASTQTIAMVLPQIDDTAETSATAKTPEIAVGAIDAETAETAQIAETAQTAETAEASILGETAEKEEKADNSETAKTTALAGTPAPASSDNVEITLSDEVTFLSNDELDDIVKALEEKDILQAVTKDGKDITNQVKAEYERIDPRGNAYKVVFTVVHEGKTSTLESIFYVTEEVR